MCGGGGGGGEVCTEGIREGMKRRWRKVCRVGMVGGGGGGGGGKRLWGGDEGRGVSGKG